MQIIILWAQENPYIVAGAITYLVVAAWKWVRGAEPPTVTAKRIAAFVVAVVTGAATIAAAGAWDWGQFLAVVLGAAGVATGIHQLVEKPLTSGEKLPIRPAFPFVLALVAALALSVPCAAEPGDIEGRLYTSLVPTPAENWGAGIAVEAWTFPETWPVVGGKLLFGDAVYLRDATALGGSVSVRQAAEDNGLRAFTVGWLDGHRKGHWCAGLSQRVAGF